MAIYIEPIRYMWDPGSLVGEKSKKFEKFMAQVFVENVVEKIEMEEYKGSWKALSPVYAQYKRDNQLSPRMWEATGELKNSLYVKTGSVIGFDNRKKHSGGERYIDIARKLEYGDSKIPPRPLFRLVLIDMNNHMNEYYDYWIMGGWK